MASLQERRLPVARNDNKFDKWSKREQLCLASAVALSGEQNWMSVSRTLKQICGNNNKRPSDWFSTKNCALQYGYLLENVETPKRKKRNSEVGGVSSNRGSSPATATEIDLIVKRLTEERIQELKEQVRRDQEEFAKIHHDLILLRSDDVTEEQLQVMWREIQDEKEAERFEELKWEKEMREREQSNALLGQRNYRTSQTASSTVSSPVPLTVPTTTVNLSGDSTDVVDMDVEDIISTSGRPAQQQTATSPLLSSLLKSPTTSAAAGTFATTGGGNSVRATAPTITTLLTSGSIPKTNQPTITLKSFIPPEEAANLLSRPISGPPSCDTIAIPSTNVNQQILSPSQSAPTLSMLLEKNKSGNRGQQAGSTKSTVAEPKTVEIVGQKPFVNTSPDTSHSKEMEVKGAGSIINDQGEVNDDSDETDPNEEQQLLEVFKNIGNIAELDIDVAAVIEDEEVDFLKGVGDEETAPEDASLEATGSADDLTAVTFESSHKNFTQEPRAINDVETAAPEHTPKVEMKECTDGVKVETTTSSDDSNDNIPLSTVASSLESKEKSQPFAKSEHLSTLDKQKVEEFKPRGNKSLLKEMVESATTSTSTSTLTSTLSTTSERALVSKIKEEGVKCKTAKEEARPEPISNEAEVDVKDELALKEKKGVVGEEIKNVDSIVVKSEDDKTADATESVSGLTKCETNSKKAETIVKQSIDDEDTGSNDDKKSFSKEKMEAVDNVEVKDVIDSESFVKNEDSLRDSTVKEGSDHETEFAIDEEENTKDQDESTVEVIVERPSSGQAQENSASECESTIAALPPPSIISIPDTDEDSSTTDISTSTAKRDDRGHASSKQQHYQAHYQQVSSPPSAHTRKSSSHDPHVSSASDHDTSSSFPSRASKRTLLNVYNHLHSNKNCLALQRALNDEAKTKRSKYCKRQMDFPSIRKNIENGTIRSMSELQRDFMLIITNVLIQKDNSAAHAAALAFRQDLRGIREFTPNPFDTEDNSKLVETERKDNRAASNSKTARTGSRKSQRITL